MNVCSVVETRVWTFWGDSRFCRMTQKWVKTLFESETCQEANYHAMESFRKSRENHAPMPFLAVTLTEISYDDRSRDVCQ